MKGILNNFLLKLLVLVTIFSHIQSVVEISISTKNEIKNLLKNNESGVLPIVVNTWPFLEAAGSAWQVLKTGGSALDAVEQGCMKCEELQCDGTVGYGGSPDENGETALDAMIMDGETHDVGAVGALRRIKSAISVARYVLERTEHTLLVGSQATDFAVMMGFREEDLSTNHSQGLQKVWETQFCQPNFWKNVVPDPTSSCGPYSPTSKSNSTKSNGSLIDEHNHDTIGMIAIDSLGRIAGGTSTNGASHKIPGRVGDSPIPGSGAYVDKLVGGAAATGDGDVMMRFMPSLLAVEYMRLGMSPNEASRMALERIVSYYPGFSGAVIAVDINGIYGASCNNLPGNVFNFSVGNFDLNGVTTSAVSCIDAKAVSTAFE